MGVLTEGMTGSNEDWRTLLTVKNQAAVARREPADMGLPIAVKGIAPLAVLLPSCAANTVRAAHSSVA